MMNVNITNEIHSRSNPFKEGLKLVLYYAVAIGIAELIGLIVIYIAINPSWHMLLEIVKGFVIVDIILTIATLGYKAYKHKYRLDEIKQENEFWRTQYIDAAKRGGDNITTIHEIKDNSRRLWDKGTNEGKEDQLDEEEWKRERDRARNEEKKRQADKNKPIKTGDTIELKGRTPIGYKQPNKINSLTYADWCDKNGLSRAPWDK